VKGREIRDDVIGTGGMKEVRDEYMNATVFLRKLNLYVCMYVCMCVCV
jgi:hypothetical protein